MPNPQANDREYDIAAAAEFASSQEAPVAATDSLGPLLVAEFLQAELERRDTELGWLRSLRQYRGQYDPEVLADIGEKRSKAFVRKTRVKVKTVDSRVADLCFPAGSEKNWTVDNTPVPNISPEQQAEIINALTKMNNGQAPNQEQLDKAVLEMVKKAAKGMSAVIEDQLVEARYKKASVQAQHSAHLYGTGIIKGPLVERKVRTKFGLEGGKWVAKSETYITPFVDYVPLWRFYPDMQATCIEDCRYAWERHLMSRAALAALASRKSFNGDKIKAYILANPDGMIRQLLVDQELKTIGERDSSATDKSGQYEVLERWGWLEGTTLRLAGLDIPEARLHESFFSNVWTLPNGDVIKAVLQPINGVTWPYHLYYFDKDETSIFAEGLGAIMCDDQTMINAGTRMALDNAAITAGGMLEVNPHLLSKLEGMDEMHPWKVWLRNATAPGQRAVNEINLNGHIPELFQLIQMFEANSDEVTAIPRYMTGENATQGAAGTASGMSMLMSAANIVIKDLITNWDEGVTRPFLQSLYRWNMQFHHDNTIKGDFDVKARGTASLVAKEVRARQLNDFAMTTANELDAPYVKRDKLLAQRAEANELSDVVKTEAEMLEETNSPQAQQQLQLAMKQQQLGMADAEAKIKKLMADAERILAQAEHIKAQAEKTAAETVAAKVGAVYSAMQAGGTATERPDIAPAGDEILRSAGWVDSTPGQTIAPVQQPSPWDVPQGQVVPQAQIPQPETGMQGMQAGIETPVIE